MGSLWLPATHAAGLSTHPGHAWCCTPKPFMAAADRVDSGHCTGHHHTTLPSEVCHHRSHASQRCGEHATVWVATAATSQKVAEPRMSERCQGLSCQLLLPLASAQGGFSQDCTCCASLLEREGQIGPPTGDTALQPHTMLPRAYIPAQTGLWRSDLHAMFNNGSMEVLPGWGMF